MGWSCSACSGSNANDAQATCALCNAIRVLECPVCHMDIRYGPRLNVGATVFHPDCFRCAACHEKLAGRFQTKDGEFYHFDCYKTLFHPRCAVCEGFIPFVPGTNRISFKVMPYWDLKFCPEHETDDRCCSCQRVEPQQKDKRFHALSDGRKVCHDCCDSIVLDTHEAQDVVKEVWAFMESVGIRNPEIPLYLVDASVLNEQCEARHGQGSGKKAQTDNRAVVSHVTRGLCLSEVSRVQHMVRRGHETVPQVVSIETNRSVNAILVLHGLPSDLTASVLAHEATHAYIKLRDDFPEQIPKQTEEGVCQLLSYLFLKYKHMVDEEGVKKRTFHARLREFYMQQIENDPSPVYGGGFRAALQAYNRTNSLQKVFDAIRHHGSFP